MVLVVDDDMVAKLLWQITGSGLGGGLSVSEHPAYFGKLNCDFCEKYFKIKFA